MGEANYMLAKSIIMYVSISVNKKNGHLGARLRFDYRLSQHAVPRKLGSAGLKDIYVA